MKYVVCAVYDNAAACFGRPIFTSAVGAAVRSLTDEVNRKAQDNQMHAHAKDFSLFELGTFDDSNGRFELLALPEKICDAISLQLTGDN